MAVPISTDEESVATTIGSSLLNGTRTGADIKACLISLTDLKARKRMVKTSQPKNNEFFS